MALENQSTMLWQLSACDAADKIAAGEISSVALVGACLERIRQTESEIGAWAFLDNALALAQAEAMDDLRRRGRPIGSLHGVPVGIKDIFDTADMPTGLGTEFHARRQPTADAAVIEKLKEAGAVILGKTVTTPMAFASASRTRNPHNFAHSPGGSSSGSAAGVAAGHVPLAIGSQTNGSVVRPASFCGVYGFKPTRGQISRRGCLRTSQSLDQVGVFARTLGDLAALTDALTGYDCSDPLSTTLPKPRVQAGARAPVPVEPVFAWFDLPFHEKLSPATRQRLEDLIESLGARVERLPAPASLSDTVGYHRTIHEYEFLDNLKSDPALSDEFTDDVMKEILARARKISTDDYMRAIEVLAPAKSFFSAFFNDYDAILAPSALGEAPLLEAGTGNPICSTIWTFAGLPCLSLPWLSGETGLPIGVQLIGGAGQDDRLFRTAAWLQLWASGGIGDEIPAPKTIKGQSA